MDNDTNQKSNYSSQLTVLQWNSHSMQNLYELRNYLTDSKIKPQVICLQETFLKSRNKIPKIPGYTVASYKHRSTNKAYGGGVLTYIVEGMPHSDLKIAIDSSDFEFCATSLYMKNETITLLNCYDPPRKDVPLATSISYTQLLDRIPTKNYILLGDFNAHHKLWSSIQNTRGKFLENLIAEKLLVILNGGEATMAAASTSPDLTLCTPALGVGAEWRPLDNACGSDHLQVVTSFYTNYNTSGTATQQKWNLNKAKWDKFKQLCSETLKMVEDLSIDRISEGFTDMLKDICEQTIPKTRPKPKNLRPPWWDIDITTAVRSREQARKKYLDKRTEETKQLYNSRKISTRNLIKDKQITKWREFVSKLDHKATSKQIWDMVNRFRGKPFDQITCLKINDNVITDDKEKANALAQHYDNMSKTENQPEEFIPVKKYFEENCNLPRRLLEEEGDNESNLNRCFNLFELNHALSSKRNSSPGADTIHYEMLKQLPDTAKLELLKVMNESWIRGEVPTEWKLATIIPIKKPNKDKLEPASYRPISLTSCVCKTMETMVAGRLTAHLENGNYLADSQSGFRPSRSTCDQLTRLESEINMAFMENKVVAAVFLDLEKAFDLMWSTGTIMQLSKFKIDGRMLKWIHNFLADRKIQVKIGDQTSDQHYLENGCPQGSVISPILFNVIINTLHDHLKKHGHIGLSQFADDGAIWFKHTSPALAVKALQTAMADIEGWAKIWGFKLSKSKTEAIIFRRKRYINQQIATLKLTLFDQEIKFVEKVKFLGLILDKHLSWWDHITDLVERCKKDLNILRLVSGTTFGADKVTLIRLYKALILSKIDYGSQAYNSADYSVLHKLDKIQNQAMRIATRALISTPINALEVECGLKPLRLRREELILKYWARSSPLGESLPVNKLISEYGCYTTKKAAQHWPYSRTVQRLIKEHNIPTEIEPPTYRKKCDLDLTIPSFTLKTQIGKKCESTADEMKIASNNFMDKKYKDKLHIYTDGSKDIDKNTAGAAFVVPSRGIKVGIKCNPLLSVFTTELIAIEYALVWILKNKIQNSVIFSDSLSSIQALQVGRSKTRPDKINDILKLLDGAKSKGSIINIEWIPSHVGIPGNEIADVAAKDAMTNGIQDNTRPTKFEIYPVINAAIMSKWQKEWDHPPNGRYTGRAYHSVQPKVKKDTIMYSDNRVHDKAYTRLRLGHSKLGFHCVWEKEGICKRCDGNSFLTDEHIFFECPAYIEQRRDLEAEIFKLGYTRVTQELLMNPSSKHRHEVVRAVVGFLKDTGLIDRI